MKEQDIDFEQEDKKYKKELQEEINSILKKADSEKLEITDYYDLYSNYKLLQKKKEYQSKIDEYKNIIEKMETDTSLEHSAEDYEALSIFCFDEKRFNKSIEYIDKAISSDPKNADYYFIKGEHYRHIGKIKEAEIEYSKAIELDPSMAETINLLKDCDKSIGELKRFVIMAYILVAFVVLSILYSIFS